MKPGDVAEFSIWLTGEETDAHLLRWRSETVPEVIAATERLHNVTLGPVSFTFKRPGDDRVPVVPLHITGINVRLLVAEAIVLPPKPTVLSNATGFVADLTKADLAKLRRMTRRAHAKLNPGDRLDDRRCDAIIEFLGPDVAMRTLRDGSSNR